MSMREHETVCEYKPKKKKKERKKGNKLRAGPEWIDLSKKITNTSGGKVR